MSDSDEYGAQLLRLAFAARDPGELPGFALYRSMIRERLLAMARVAYKQTWQCVGERSMEACFFRYLSTQPPASPLIRLVIERFEPFALHDRQLLSGAPPFTSDLLRFEAAKWRAASAPELVASAGARELDFMRPLLLNPSLSVLALTFRVGEGALSPSRSAHELLVYRPTGVDDVRWYACDGLLAHVLRAAQAEPLALATLLPRALRELALPADEPQLEAFAGALAVAVERGVLLGVLD